MHQLSLRIFSSFLVVLLSGAVATAEPDCPTEPSYDDAPWNESDGTKENNFDTMHKLPADRADSAFQHAIGSTADCLIAKVDGPG